MATKKRRRSRKKKKKSEPRPEGTHTAEPSPPRDEITQEFEIEVDQPLEQPHRGALEALLDEVASQGLGVVAPRPDDEVALAALDAVEVERAPRVPFEGYVRVEKDDRVVRALAQDLSETGIYLAAMGSPIAAQGESLHLELPLPDGDEPIWTVGRVVRCEDRQGFFAVAVAFGPLPEAEVERIRAYVEARAHLLG